MNQNTYNVTVNGLQKCVNYFTVVALSTEGTPDRYTVCANTNFQASCVVGEVIAVQGIQHGAKSGCSADCCVYNIGDCLLPYVGTALQELCSGKKLCAPSSPSEEDASTCSGSGYPHLSQYLTMEFYCLNGKLVQQWNGSTLDLLLSQYLLRCI